ncbi:MAG: polysulfide reductase NrfD [Ktedonobacteraceae bacterium]|nr:polysulfide reductase NrfD [Ktedonobacteraceae bacterium]MBO0791167.1 polysulfide reductase NrfD [Ktedonobacteraceae bacterium]
MSQTNGQQAARDRGTVSGFTPDRTGFSHGERWSGQASNYYHIPLIKKAHWSWEIMLYFFLGGLAGGSSLASTVAHLFGSEEDTSLVRAGRYVSLVSIIISPILLIKDLGRPERFVHMLRVLKLRSAMSLGTWGLTTFGLLCGLTAGHQMAMDGLLDWFAGLSKIMKALPVKATESVGSIFGLFVGSYTGVLLSSTAVPIWARARHILGPLFLTSGLSTALASLSLILSLGRGNRQTMEKVERAELAVMATELGLISALPAVLGSLARPLLQGRTAVLFGAGTIGGGLLLPLLARLGWKLTKKPTPRGLNIGASLLVLAGGLVLRYVWIAVGRASADDPQATHHYNAMD